jgi:UDPglucose 6-dehydrogenase
VRVYGPQGAEKARAFGLIEGAEFASSPLDAVQGAEALILATEWEEFANADLAAVKASMHTPLVFDGRNLFDPSTMREMGFVYHGIGRPA